MTKFAGWLVGNQLFWQWKLVFEALFRWLANRYFVSWECLTKIFLGSANRCQKSQQGAPTQFTWLQTHQCGTPIVLCSNLSSFVIFFVFLFIFHSLLDFHCMCVVMRALHSLYLYWSVFFCFFFQSQPGLARVGKERSTALVRVPLPPLEVSVWFGV